ncbi:cyclophane-forming radical SAM peptide maturase AmcB [Actinomadura litoris]|uniref:cyclophane-forming radical SAM peptide maturase AmcB n=1 Tax=Actinomadura litoris TaxID=2678616 RepID=UPI001FA70135|nr:cyclophane-forming radical SAM peptide maturase AmcB [Actinomadura litoris]
MDANAALSGADRTGTPHLGAAPTRAAPTRAAAPCGARRAGFDDWINRTFDTVVLQPTSLCNLDCAYCYLPARKKRNELLPAVARAVAASIAQQTAQQTAGRTGEQTAESDRPVTVVWHGGEPTALPITRFADRLAAFEDLRRAGRVRHSIQTNATLIDHRWCRLLRDHGFEVGVSIDGPAAASLNRVGWTGRPAFDQIMRGIGLLREHQIPFSVICVVSPQTIADPGGLMAFFDDLGCTRVGFNIEEREGVNTRTPVDAPAAQAFWQGVLNHHTARPRARGGHRGARPRVREIDQLADYLTRARDGRKEEWTTAKHDPIPTIAWNGDTVLMSPELLGIHAPRHRDFVVGNVLKESLPTMLRQAHQVGYIQELLGGLAACRAECAFFDFCRGAHAGNRYFEHGTFAATETAHCRNTRQALVTAFATTIKE